MHALGVETDMRQGSLTLPGYPFPRRATRRLERADIVEVIDWFPLAVLTRAGEFLFVSREQLDNLKAFCAATGIPFTNRFDVWGCLLDPFLDTEFSEEFQRATDTRIEECGLSREEIVAIRAEVESPMLRHTARTWEWQHYGLYDVLYAVKPVLPAGRAKWRAFYGRAMEIARMGLDRQ